MSDCEDPAWFSSPPQDQKVEEFKTGEDDGPEPYTNPGESVSASDTVLLRTVSSNLEKIQAIPAVRENSTPSPAASLTNEVQPHSGRSESKPAVLRAEQENKLADAQAEQTGDTEQVKRYYLTAKKSDCIVEASEQGESDNASSFLPPNVAVNAILDSTKGLRQRNKESVVVFEVGTGSLRCAPRSTDSRGQLMKRGRELMREKQQHESKLDEKQNVSPQSSDEPHAETKNSGSFQNEVIINSPVVPDLVTVCADPTVSSADMETGEVLSTLPLQNSLCPDTSHQYNQLIELLHHQEEKCKRYYQQFSHMGNITETTRFENLAEECAFHTEALRVAKVKGYPVPKFHMEDRTFNIFRIIPELSGSDMLLTIVRGVNLPGPEGGSPNDLETSVRFEFAFPSLQEAQRDQTRSVKNSSSPEFGEQFTLHIKRNHRGFKRVVLSKGIKFEIIQKGGLFKTDKVVGCAQLKLDSLESKCEIRQLIEVFKRRTPTGGHLEVRVKIREPLSGPQSETVTEKWLVLDPLTLPLVVATKPQIQDNPVKQFNNRSATCSVL
ncbi:hypothetical protein AOLI_G00175280 [Acnodon oligacanthus]